MPKFDSAQSGPYAGAVANSVVNVEGVSFSYNAASVLSNIHFTMNQDDFVAIIGPNGGGKSTLIKLIVGLLKPNQGKIDLFGESPEHGRRFVGYLSQSSNVDLDFPIRVADVVMMSRLLGNPFRHFSASDRADALSALERVGIAHLANRSLSQLSGGEKQRVFLSRVLMNRPRLLILDEPTASVDVHAESGFYDLLTELNKTMAILMISHDISAVSHVVKKIACLNKKLVYHNTKEITAEDLAETYGCPVDLIAHGGIPHRVLKNHD